MKDAKRNLVNAFIITYNYLKRIIKRKDKCSEVRKYQTYSYFFNVNLRPYVT